MKTYVKYGAVLIGIYLGVAYATGSKTLLSGGKDAAVSTIKAFQGR